MANQNNDIVYDIINHELKTDLPTASEEKDYNFVFEGFTDEAYHKGNKPYVFIANMTQSKKNEIQSRGASLAQETDDKGVLFDWGDLIWHYDFLFDDYMDLWNAGEIKDGRIYFTRRTDDEIINTPGQVVEEEQVDNKIKGLGVINYKSLIQEAVSTIQAADKIIKESQS